MNMAEYIETTHTISLNSQEIETIYNALNRYVDETDEDTHGLLLFFEDFLEDEENEEIPDLFTLNT